MPARRVLHLVSQAHLDPVWLWPRCDGIAEVLTTFQSAVDRLRETPSFRFSRSSSCAYEWVRDNDPRLFAEIRDLVRAGRWEVVGGWFEQPDCNLPSAESFLRQALHARAFFDREFGPESRTAVGYNVDSFGHCGALPQLLRSAGLDAYAFMRPEPWDNPDLPLLFHWESPDGSRVLAVRIPGGYSQSYSATADDIDRIIRGAPCKNFAPGFEHGVLWFGVGNHGGGPTREHIARVLELQNDPALPEIRFSTLRDFVSAVRASPAAADLPVVRGELGHVFRGCYAANGETKRRHRAAERDLFAAEALAAREGVPSAADLAAAWGDLLFLQFHDILAGTCVAPVQEEILDRFGSVRTRARDAVLASALRLARRVDTSGEPGSVLFACNPLPWARRAIVALDTFVKIHGRDEVVGLVAPDGSEVPVQWLPADANFGPWGLHWAKLAAFVDLPASGYGVFRLQTRPVDPAACTRREVADPNNPQFGIADNPSAASLHPIVRGHALTSIASAAGRELLSAPVRFAVVRDTGGTWGHGRRAYDEVLGCPEVLGHEEMAAGPLLSITREKSRWGESEIWMDVIRARGSDDIELRLRINWQQRREQLKLEIPARLVAASTKARMPAEVAERPCDGSEFPCHDWVVLEGSLDGQSAALAVLNDSTYSYAAEGGVLRFTIMRGVPHAEHPPFDYQDTRNVFFLDQGWQERRFVLRALGPGWSPGALSRAAEEFQIPAIAFLDSAHPGSLPRSHGGISVSPESVAVLAVKPAREGEGVIVRIQEFAGRPTTARITGPQHAVKIRLRPWEIFSALLRADGSWETADIFERAPSGSTRL